MGNFAPLILSFILSIGLSVGAIAADLPLSQERRLAGDIDLKN